MDDDFNSVRISKLDSLDKKQWKSVLNLEDNGQEKSFFNVLKKTYLHDPSYASSRTWERRFVEKYLIKSKWYNPYYAQNENEKTDEEVEEEYPTPGLIQQLAESESSVLPSINEAKIEKKKETPSLRAAWVFFEHYTLYRHKLVAHHKDKRIRVVPGYNDSETSIYSVIWTNTDVDLDSWGVGVVMYFKIMKIFVVIFMLIGLLNIPLMIYYASEEYNGVQSQNNSTVVDQISKSFQFISTSAVCKNYDYVPCFNCSKKDMGYIGMLYENVTSNSTHLELIFVKKNFCPAPPFLYGMLSLVGFFFAVSSMTFLNFYLDNLEKRADEQIVSTGDYSICVTNPPENETDPEKWRDFFSRWEPTAKPPLCTISLNNGELMKTVRLLKHYELKLIDLLSTVVDMDDTEMVQNEIELYERQHGGKKQNTFVRTVIAILNRFDLLLTPTQLWNRIQDLEEERNSLLTEKFTPSAVFITMETEEGQRTALEALDTGKLAGWGFFGHKTTGVTKFNGKTVLEVSEAVEPSAVRWIDLSSSTLKKQTQLFITSLVLGLILMIQVFLVGHIRNTHGPLFGALFVTAGNIYIYGISLLLMKFEEHSTEGNFQKSMYLKLTVFRWVNTAIIPMLITPSTNVLSDGSRDLIPTIASVLIFDLYLTPLLQLADPYGFLKKHFLAPRFSKTQAQMNSYFLGTPFNISERYTDLTKMMFLCFYYSVLYPAGFIIVAAAISIKFWVDKYCLLRVYSPSAAIGPQVGNFGKTYFFRLAVLVGTIQSAYFWCRFPFDNLCLPVDSPDNSSQMYNSSFYANYTLPVLNISVEMTDETTVYHFCDFKREQRFPPIPESLSSALLEWNWMTVDQIKVTRIYGWTTVVILIAFLISTVGVQLFYKFMSLFKGLYKTNRTDNKMDFSDCIYRGDIVAYIPHIKNMRSNVPYYLCDFEDLHKNEPNLIGRKLTDEGYKSSNLVSTFDKKLSSTVTYWPRFKQD